MSAGSEEDEGIVSITEWPVTSSSTDIHSIQQEVNLKRSFPGTYDTVSHYPEKKSRLELSAQFCQQDSANSHSHEPLGNIRIARWWRQNKQKVDTREMPHSTNPNTTLVWVSRTKECQQFLREEEALLRGLVEKHGTDSASCYAALASVRDWQGQIRSALHNIHKAVSLDPQNNEYQWLREKLARQNKIQIEQTSLLKKLPLGNLQFPQFTKVDRVSINDLSKKEFFNKYVKTQKPVILLDLVKEMTQCPWDLNFVRKTAGKKKVLLKKLVPLSAEWAQLEDSSTSTVEDFIDNVKRGETKDYLFDWSLPLHCPELDKTLKLPSFFEDNYLLATAPGSLYRHSWPSLFVAPAAAVSQLHVDAFASSFWMALFEGEKRWTFFPPSDLSLLYPTYTHSMDPVFSVNLTKPDLHTYPLLAFTHPSQCVLQPGELLYVPSGSPHFVENLSVSLAVSSNHVDESNYKEVCEQLRVNGLVDPHSDELQQQLQKKYG